MKLRILIPIAVLFFSISLVALVLKTFSYMIPEPAQVDQSNLSQAMIQSPEPENESGSGDSIKRSVDDVSDQATTRLAWGTSPSIGHAAQSEFVTIPWSPPIQYQIPTNPSNAGQIPPSAIPSDQSQSHGEVQQAGDYASPAGRAGSLAGIEPEVVSPVNTLPVIGEGTPSNQSSPESIKPPPPGVSVDMAYDIIYGYLNAGDLVTATTLSGSAFGTTQADGNGYFFSPLWVTDGHQVDLVGGETINIYVNGMLLETITTPTFSGEMLLGTNQVTGTVGELLAGDVVTVSLGIWGWEPTTETPWVTATTDSNGTFTAAFSADLGPHNFARVETNIDGERVYHYVYPLNTFHVDSFNYIFGYAQPYRPVTVTVYLSDTSTVRDSQTVKSNWPHGDYTAELMVVPGDTVEVDLGDGNQQTLKTSSLTAQVNLSLNRLTGQAPAEQDVRVFIYNWMLGIYTETVTIADPSGYYTATFPTYDLTPQDAVYPAYAGSGGSEVLLSIFPPGMQVFPDDDQAIGRGDAAYTPYTYTLTQGENVYFSNGTTDALNGTDWANFGVDIVAGDLITLETPTWSGSMVIADLSLSADTANDRYLGSVDQDGEVIIASFPWPAWSYPIYKFDSGNATVTTAVTSTFTINLPGQDVRAGVSGRVVHYDSNYFVTRKNFEVRYFELDLPWGVSSPQYYPDEVITATLYYSDHQTIKHLVSTDYDSNPEWYWLDFNGELAAGDWITVTNGSDWIAGLQVPDLSTSADRKTDLISGTAPETLLYMDAGDNQNWLSTWVPSYKDGAVYHYAVDASAFGVEMDFGSWATVYYQADNGNRARRSFGFPDLYARYNPDGSSSVFGNNAIPGDTIYITITNPISGVVASGTTEAGTAWMGPTSYNLDFPSYGFSPGDVIHIDYGSGLTNTLEVVELTAQADIDTDQVTGLAPANSYLNAWISDITGYGTNLDQIQVSSSGAYTVEFGEIEWDIKNGDSLSVYYQAGSGGVVERAIYLPIPDLNLGVYNTNGGARPGGPYAYGVWYSNDGDLAAQDVQLVLTLPPSTTWSGDTSGVIPEIGDNGVVTWSMGMLAPYEQHNIFVTVLLDPAHPEGEGALAALCGNISTSTNGDGNPDNNSSCAGNTFVMTEDIDIRVDKWANPGDVVAGQEFVYDIQYCNDRNTAAGPVWLTDTLPVSTTFVSLTPRNWWGEKNWSQEDITNGALKLYFPSIPGQNCTNLNLRLLADAGLTLNTPLYNHVAIFTPWDTYTDNNWKLDQNAQISNPRADLGLSKYLDNAILVPGGELYYKLDYYNNGNISLSGRLTDTLPLGTEYVEGSAYDYNGQPVATILVDGNQVVWDVGEISVNSGFGFTYRLSISDTVTPGTSLENCATIGHASDEDTPWDNTACDERIVQDTGPNLEVSKYHEWYGDGWLHYEITFRNLGDQDVYGPIITDTYPLSTTFAGWGTNFWNNISFTNIYTDRQLIWQIDQLPAGNSGSINFEAPLNNPGQRMITYTNNLEIITPEGESNPADNIYIDEAFSGGEVDRAEMNIGTDSANVWGSAQPGSTVSLLNRGITYTAYADPDCGGCFNVDYIGPLWPGDTITITAGAGRQPVVIHVPDPFTALGDSRTDQVTGQVGVPEGSRLRVELYGYTGEDVFVDASGFYTATFNDIPRNGEGHVQYETTIDYTQTYIYRRYKTQDLTMSVNYGHDWVNGRYEIGHTVWITVTESDGSSIKATAEVETYFIPWWNGDSGFQPEDQDWEPNRPDLQAGDWVYGAVDTGYTTTVQLGEITGVVDPNTDSISGAVSAPWITQSVDLRCHTWGSPNNAPQKQDYVLPDGVDMYTCTWNPLTEWDVQAGQDIGVEYYEPDGDSVFNVFHAPSPDLAVQINPQGTASEGGNLQLQVQYVNQGEIDSNNVVITQTLQGMQYLGDTSGLATYTGTTPGGVPYVVYQLGTLTPGNWTQFDVFAQVTEQASQTITSTVHIVGTPDGGDLNNNTYSWSDLVRSNDTHINLGKGAWTGDPVAGGQFVWWLSTCNYGSTSSSAIILTDTLPVSTTLIGWWGQHPGWSEVLLDTTRLVVTRPSLPNGWCSQVYLRFQVDADVPVGTIIQNSADVWTANDIEINDNHTENWVGINNPHTNIGITQWWGGGSLVPGGTFRYQMQYSNSGNIPVDAVFITDTLPVSTTLNYIRHYDMNWNFLGDVTPTYIGNQIVWEVGRIENGENGNYEISVTADPDATPSITLVNAAEISRLPDEDTYTDNTSTWTETLFGHGPNLRINKDYWWNGDSQLGYQIDFSNVGDQAVSSVWITDILPDNSNWDGWWNMGFDWNRLVTQTLTADQLSWQFTDINPEDGGWIQYNANLDDPDARPRWYTNTATISLDPADTNPADNTATTTVVLGEVERVEMWVSPGTTGIWGEAQPGVAVTVTTPYEQLTTLADPNCSGCWGVGTSSPLQPGDKITVTAGLSTLPVVINVPDPFIVQADSSTDTVWGQIDSLNNQTVQVDLYGYGGTSAQTDETGNFTVSFPDIPLVANGQVSYLTTIDYANVYFYYRFQANDLLLRVNVAHEWVEAVYPAGHTVWITVTNGLNEAIYEGFTQVGAVRGNDGFGTSGDMWSPSQPDIQEGDWVYARSDDGKTAQVQVGVITGELDLLADSISGTIIAPFSTTLRVVCEVYIENAPPSIEGTVDPAGGSYSCSWAGTYDLQPDMSVAVNYYEPDGHQIIDVFWLGRPSVFISKGAYGQFGEGGNFIYHINYQNRGYDSADNVVITDTLPVGMSYLGDNAPFPLVSTDPLVWEVGSLTAGTNASFDLYVQVNAQAGTLLTNTVRIDTSTPWDTAPPEDKVSTWADTVQANDTHMNIGVDTTLWDPAPGSQYDYYFNVCNSGATASSGVVFTATLPVSTTLSGWIGGEWSQQSFDGQELVLSYPSITAGNCLPANLTVQLSASAPQGLLLEAIGVITASNDMESYDNQTTIQQYVSSSRIDQWVGKWFSSGTLTPGSIVQYNIQYGYDANFNPGSVTITETLPVDTTFVNAWWNGPSGQETVTPAEIGTGYVVFKFNDLTANNYGNEFFVRILVNEAVLPGTVLTNTAQIQSHAVEGYLDNNLSSSIVTLLAHNADLQLSSGGGWDLPNNIANLGFSIYNAGDLDSGSTTITVTYPTSMSLISPISGDWRMTAWQDYPEQHYFTATMSNLESGGWANFSYNTQMQGGGLIPGGQVFTFDTEVSVPPADFNPENNHASYTLTSGPDLFVEKTLTSGMLVPGGSLTYNLYVGNRSTANGWNTQGSVLITDTLPAGLTYAGSSWGESLVDGQTIVWDLGPLYAGWEYGIDVYATITNTAQGGDVFTNTVVITSTSPADVDINPGDNTSSVTIMVSEVNQVDLQLGVENAWINGYAQPNSNLTVQTISSSYTYTVDSGGWWSLSDIGSVQPGDVVTVTAGSGILPVLIHVPDPFSVNIDSTLEQVWGQIGGATGQTVYVDPWGWENPQQVLADPSGVYTATFGDIPTNGASGEVRYAQTIDYAQVMFHRSFHEAYVNLWVDKSASGVPAPGGNYTYQINYRNDSGDIASNVILTDTLPTGMSYISDNSGITPSLNGNQVAWQLGDLGNISNGFQMVVAVDPGLIPGIILTNTVQIATPSFEWEYADNIYQWAINVGANDTHLNIGINPSLGNPAPGSQYSYNFNVCNNGSTASTGVVLTATLPISTTLTGWTGGGWSELRFEGDELVLSYPSVSGFTCAGADLNVHLDANATLGQLLEASGVITASNDMENNDNQAVYQHYVVAPEIDRWVRKFLYSGPLVPGSILHYNIQYGYGANFSPGMITITDTLPVSTTFVDAWWNGPSGQETLTPVEIGTGYVVFEFNDLTANSYSNEFFVRILVDEAAIPGTQLVNTAEVRLHALETYLDNNLSSSSVTLLPHNADLSVNSWGGWNWENTQANLGFYIYNSGDLDSGPLTITVTYPISMSLAGDISGDWRMIAWQDYPEQGYFTATLNNLESGGWAYFYYNTQMQGGGQIPGDQVFNFETDVLVPPYDFNPDNNHSSFSLTSATLPLAPSDLGATALSCTQINLSWTDNSSDETDFRVERSLDGSSGWAEVATVNAESTTYTDTVWSAATTFYYRVRAYRSGDAYFSAYSEIVSATTHPCTLVIQPSVITGGIGQNFDVVVEVQVGNQLVDVASAYLDFDPSYLEVVSITLGSALPVELQKDFAIPGQVNISAGTFDNFPSGTFTLATVTFHAINLTAGTPIVFYDVMPRMSDIAFAGHSFLSGTEGGTVMVVTSASIQGSVNLQRGIILPPDPSWSVPLRISLTPTGETTPTYTFTPTTDDSGGFNLTDIITGTYDVRIKNSHTLQNLTTVTLLPGPNGIDFGTLREGDVNDDNFVVAIDFSLLRATYNKCQGTGGYDDRADFNEDSCVTGLDFSLLRPNYGQGGASQIPSPDVPITGLGNTLDDVWILVEPAQRMVQEGETFTLTIKVQSGSELMDTVQASLDFDPAVLQVNSLTGNTTAFPVELQKQFNNSEGTIDYGAGAFSNFPSGDVDVVEIEFTALVETLITPLTFHYGMPRDTDVIFAGYTLLTGDVDGQIQIGMFNKTDPTDGAVGVPITPTLTWTTSLGAISYEYCYDNTDDDDCDGWTDNGTNTSIGLPELSPSTTYYWHVRAVNSIETIYTDLYETAFWSFTTEAPTPIKLFDFTTTSKPQGIQLDWKTAQEIDLVGFNIYRANEVNGSQVMINAELIPGVNPGELRGNDYQYLDSMAETGKVYYYWVEWVENTGSELYGPVATRLARYTWLPSVSR